MKAIKFGMETNQKVSNLTLPLNLQEEKSELFKLNWKLKKQTKVVVKKARKSKKVK